MRIRNLSFLGSAVLFFATFEGLSQTILSETFEGLFPSDNGWSVGDANAAGVTAYWDDVDLRTFGTPPTFEGSWAGYCAGIGFGGTTTSPLHQHSMAAYMSKSIDLSGYATATLRFWYVIPSIENCLFGRCDYLRVMIDNNEVFFRGSDQPSWTLVTVNLNAYVGGSHTLKFEFVSDGSFRHEGAYLDDIRLTATVAQPDLVATEVYFRDESGDSGNRIDNPQVGQQLYPHFAYTLSGSTVSGKIWTIQLDGSERCSYTGTVSPGSYVGWCNSPWTVTAGSHTIRGVVNPDGTITESNYGNNIATRGFTPPTLSFGGRVTDVCTSSGVAGATVQWGPYARITDGSGSYSFNSVPCGVQTLTVSHPNYITHTETHDPPCLSNSVKDIALEPIDPNDELAEAEFRGNPTPGNPVTVDNGKICPATDVDLFPFDVSAGQRLAFDVDRRNASNLDSYLRLFNSNGTQLDFSDDDPACGELEPPENRESYLEFTFTTAGRYYVGVSAFNNSSYNPNTGAGDTAGATTGDYRLIMTDFTPPTPDLVSVTGIPVSIGVGQSFTVTVTAENDAGWGSRDSAINASVLYSNGSHNVGVSEPTCVSWADWADTYMPGEGPIYDNNCQPIPGGARDHLIEAADHSWVPAEQHQMCFTVTPQSEGTLFIRVRTTMRSGCFDCPFINDTSADGGIATDQQGWTVRQYSVVVGGSREIDISPTSLTFECPVPQPTFQQLDGTVVAAEAPFECRVISVEDSLRVVKTSGERGMTAFKTPPNVRNRLIQPSQLSAPTSLTPADLFLFEDTGGILTTPGYTDAQRDTLMVDAANALMAAHGDNFDFVGFWLNFVPDHQFGDAFYKHIENNVTGIGLNTFDARSALGLAGSNIEGMVMMWNVNRWNPGSDRVRLVLGQEFEHRFGMYLLNLQDGRRLQGDGCGRSTHWNFKVDGQGSAMEIGAWTGSSPATRTFIDVSFNTDIPGGLFSYVDLYLMGYVTPAEMDAGMSELRYMNDDCPATYNGTISTFGSADIVASNGTRSPGSSQAQKNFHTGWIMIHRPGALPTSAEISQALRMMEQFTADWSTSTLGRGQMDNSLPGGPNSFVIENTGNAELTITSITTETPCNWISWSPTAPFTIPPGNSQSVRVSVNCDQAPLGETTCRLLVHSNDQDESPYPGGVYIHVNNRDTEPPRITCPSDITTGTDQGQCSRNNVTYTPTATDNVAVTSLTCSPPSGSTFPKGTTPVICTATDGADNSRSCTFAVTINDTESPVITGCPTDIVHRTDVGLCTALVSWTQPTATDNCDGSRGMICVPASGSIFPTGMTMVSCEATDNSGNRALCNFTVTVEDSESPIISCPTGLSAECSGANGAQVFFNVSAMDNCSASVAVTCNPPSGSYFPVGSTSVSCDAADGNGNTAATCAFTVTVTDPVRPRLRIGREDANVLVCWPQTCTSYTLERAASLGSSTVWSEVDAPIVSSEGENCVTVPIGSGNAFFRLRAGQCSLNEENEFGVLTSQPSADVYGFDFDGRLVVWRDTRDGGSIYAYDIQSGSETKLSYTLGNVSSCKVSAGLVVWYHDDRKALMAKDVFGRLGPEWSQNGQNGEVQIDPIIGFGGVDVDGDWVAWSKGHDGTGGDIVAYNLRTKERIEVPRAGPTQWSPSLSGEHLLFTVTPGHIWNKPRDWDVYEFSLGSRTLRAIKAGPGSFTGTVEGEKVLLKELPAYVVPPLRSFRLLDLTTAEEQFLFNAETVVLSGDNLVYRDEATKLPFLSSLQTGQRCQISGNTCADLTIGGNTIVWISEDRFIYGQRIVGSGAVRKCVTVQSSASVGTLFGDVVQGQWYSYEASGCVEFGGSAGHLADPDGSVYSGDNCTGPFSTQVAGPSRPCPGLRDYSLVGKVNGRCMQLGRTGVFQAPSSGHLVLYFQDGNYADNSGSWDVCISSSALNDQ